MFLFLFTLLFQQPEELYEELLYKILHNAGCETENETHQAALFSYIQDAFKVNKIKFSCHKNVIVFRSQ